MELRHLRYFVTVAEELHFGRAAERLGIAQPPLSQQIKALEQEIGVALLSRSKRQVRLTAAGKAFLGEARKTLALAEQAVRSARRAARGETGRLEVGYVSSAVYGEIAAIFRQMRSRYPDIALVLQDLSSEEQVEAMLAHRLDIGLVRPPVVGAESLQVQSICREPLAVALPQSHHLARRKAIALEELAGESFLQVARRHGPGFYDQLIRICARAGFSPRIVQEARTVHTIINLIDGAMGVSIVPASLHSFQPAGVVYRPLKAPAPTTELAAMWRPDDASPALRSFLEIVWQVAELKQPPPIFQSREKPV